MDSFIQNLINDARASLAEARAALEDAQAEAQEYLDDTSEERTDEEEEETGQLMTWASNKVTEIADLEGDWFDAEEPAPAPFNDLRAESDLKVRTAADRMKRKLPLLMTPNGNLPAA